ncbi:macrophage mannose receptor 1-like isoform X2 [Lytechinus variegatus]|uniref:macrophage mannose receptor 1-like isoform X2 n=1 Tax=Lytechinus variegatus TaxID=7654 RepID=UPI001BB14CC9|nr:macrophage mannose receptor 1-like isoform X2 [Lytechinus variegatus]
MAKHKHVVCQLCPSGWSLNEERCYKVYTDTKTYHEAQQFCKQNDGDLAMVKTNAVNDLLSKLLQDAGVNVGYLGLHDLANEDSFYWVDGTPLTSSQSHWGTGEPSDDSGNDDCVQLKHFTDGDSDDWYWIDISCTISAPYICERSNELPLACDESTKWYGAAGQCYKYYSFKRSWVNADNYCRSVGGTLISVNSEEEQTLVANQVSVSQKNVWLGLSDTVGGAAGYYKWSTGESLSYSNWGTGQPDNRFFTSGGDCAEILESDPDGKWSTDVCTTAKYFMCERPEGYCPAGWHLYRGHCYQFNIQHPTKWKTAKFTCEAQGAYLLTSLNSAENTYIVNQMKDYHDIGVESSWLGLSDTETDGSFVWVEGSSLSYTNWDVGQPVNTANNEDCVYITTGDGTGKWSTKNCGLENPYICKIKASIPITPLDPQIGVRTCDDGWTLNGVSCFYFVGKGYLYNDAEENCKTLGGHLASIHSQREQNFLSMRARMGGAYLWIGFHDYNTENVFSWTDGTSNDFQNWANGQPDNWKSGEDAVHMRTNEVDAGKWNDIDGDTTKLASVCKKPSSDGTSVNPPVVPTPAFDPRCGNGWDYDETSQNCYLFKYSEYKSWLDAREYCQTQGGDLASITSPAEQSYINGRLFFTTENDMWIGGTDFTKEGGWEWTDGSGFGYLNWAPDEPNNVGSSEHCMEIFTKTDTWNDNQCERQRGFICKKNGYITTHFYVTFHNYLNGPGQLVLSGVFPDECASRCVKMTDFTCKSFNYNRVSQECTFNDGSTSTPMSDGNMDYYERLMEVRDPPITTLGPGFRCPQGWSGYGDSCYFMYVQSKLTYSEIQQKCQDLGGDLASIHDINENSFIQALARENGMDVEFWIGLHDQSQAMNFQWVDNTQVDFTLWNTNEPNNYQGTDEDCVEMYLTGYWNDNLCSRKWHGACKRPKEDLGPTLTPVVPSGCELGEIANGGSCYFVMDTPKSWEDARDDCARFDPRGNLVSIMDRYEQSVLTSILGGQDGSLFWIGLSDSEKAGQYRWSDNTFVTLTNWDYEQPDDSKGECVASTTGIMAGLWRNMDCTSKNKYICERGREGYPAPQTIGPTTIPTAPSNAGCYDDRWKGYGNNCYMLVISDVSGSTRRNWNDARTFCLAMGADLASFHSQAEEDYILSGYPNNPARLYVGLHDITEEGGFEWSDGTPVEHTNWNPGEPNNWGPGEDCTEVFLDDRNWNDIYCTNLNDWICKIQKGVVPTYTTMAPPTITPYPPCPSNQDWILFPPNNYCYFFSQGLSLDAGKKSWMNANEYCMQSGGYLVSIHNQEENDFLNSYMLRFGIVEGFDHPWIGLREYTTEGVFTWSDRTAVDFTSWADGEPNDYNGEEQCAEFYYPAGSWNDANCAKETVFVCRKPFGSIGPVTYPPTNPPIGNCQPGWIRFDNRCYKMYGIDDPNQRMSWFEARDTCKAIPNTNLVTIHSHELQAFLTSKLIGTNIAMWIGLSDSIISGRFFWTDGSSVDYTYWNSGEPNNYGSGEDCTEMIAIETWAGKWNDLTCDANLGFICQGVLDPNGQAPTDDPNSCRNGFTQYGTACYQVLDRPYVFSEAQEACKALGNDVSLSSVNSWYEEAFAETMSHTSGGDPLWIGFYAVSGEYKWLDSWPVWFTAWGPSEPSAAPGEGCVTLLPSGGWDDTNCQGLFKPLCKYSLITTPTEHPEMPGYCPDDWTAYHDGCYKVFAQDNDRMSWPEAQFKCDQLNGSLASIHTRQEMEIIRDLMTDGRVDIWSGLRRGDSGGFEWEDATPVDYTNWNNGEPSFATQPGYEDCVEMYLSTGKWNDVDCLNEQGYVCEQPKIGGEQPIPDVQGLTIGAIVGIIIAAVIIVCGIALIVFFIRSKQGSLSMKMNDTSNVPGSVGFDNALYKADGDNTIQIKEPNSDSKA